MQARDQNNRLRIAKHGYQVRANLVIKQKSASVLKLPEDWINSASADLWKIGLPEGFQDRLDPPTLVG